MARYAEEGRKITDEKEIVEKDGQGCRLRASWMTFVRKESRLKRKTEVDEAGSLSNWLLASVLCKQYLRKRKKERKKNEILFEHE